MPMGKGVARRMFNDASWTMGTLGRQRNPGRVGFGPRPPIAESWGKNNLTAAQVRSSGRRRVVGGAIGGSMVLSSFRNRKSSGSGRY